MDYSFWINDNKTLIPERKKEFDWYMDNWWKGYADSNKNCGGKWVLKYGQEYCTKNNCNVTNLSFKMTLSNDLTKSMAESNLLTKYLKMAINEYVYQNIMNSYAHINNLMSKILWATTQKTDPNPECGTKYDKYLFNEIVILLNDLKSDNKFKSGIPLNYRNSLEQMFSRLSILPPENEYCHIENNPKSYVTGNTKISKYDLNYLLSSRNYLFFNDNDIATLYNPSSNSPPASINVTLTNDNIATFNIEFNNIKYDIANKIKDIFNIQNNVTYKSASDNYFILYLFNVFGIINNNSRLFSNVFKKVLSAEQIKNTKIQIDNTIAIDDAKINGKTGSTYVWLYSKPDATQIIDCNAAKLRGFVGQFENLNIDIQKGQTYSGMEPCEKNTALFFDTNVNCELRQLMSEKNIECSDDIVKREINKNSSISLLCNK